MNIDDRKSQIKLITLILILFLSAGIVLAIFAAPAATTELRAQTCNTETASATPDNFVGACTATSLNINDATTQTATVNGNNLYMGVNMTAYNTSILNCGQITNVRLCYEWWSSNSNIGTCTVQVDANGGISYKNASTTCPGTSPNPGTICTDVTSLESWTCDNFFGASGTRSLGALQVKSTTGGSKTLTVDALFFNVTYSADNLAPSVYILYPGNTTYTNYVTHMNLSIYDPNIGSCWWTNSSGATNYSFTCTNNITTSSAIGTNTWTVYSNDSFGNLNTTSVTFSINPAPTITSINISSNPTGVSSLITIFGNNTNDTNSNSLSFFCSETSSSPTDNSLCTGGGNLTGLTRPYNPSCSYYHGHAIGNYTVYCRVYDGLSYSSTVNQTYEVRGLSFSTSIASVAGDFSPSYFDTNNDGITEVNVSGASGMSCRWSSSDVAYSSMTTECTVSGIIANCTINDVSSQGFYTRYVACKDIYGNEQTASDNLNVPFYLDYTKPTTTSNALSTIQVPTYTVTITELDNVDTDPTSYYCTSTSSGCDPITSIDNGSTISYTSANRGVNYLRFYSVDDAGNSQVVVNQTININQLPVFTSASDNAITIKGGSTITISTNSNDPDSQTLRLYVCSTASSNSNGCIATTYCSATGSGNLSCGFASETDTASHTWYAYLYDSLNESASNNPLTESYTTDSTPPILTIISPTNTTYTQGSVTFTVLGNEPLLWANYSLNNLINNSLSNSSAYEFTGTNSTLLNGSYSILYFVSDLYGNTENSSITFTIDTSLGDISPPGITILAPINNTYLISNSLILNITSDEGLSWVGYFLDSNGIANLSNFSSTNWNATITLAEGQHNITFFANDSSSNKNQANKSSAFWIDLTNPQVSSFLCNDANDSQDVTCSGLVSDSIGLSYAIVSWNATGTWQNSSSINLSSSSTFSYTINAANTTPGGFKTDLYLYDLSGRTNLTESDTINIRDDKYPGIYNISYTPNSTEFLDPGVTIHINSTVVEDYSMGDVSLMYKNSSSSSWNSVIMTNLTSKTANSAIGYNASAILYNGTWQIKINATDTTLNSNYSDVITLDIENENAFFNSTSIDDIESFIYTQRADNNSLGYLFVNNTGDTNLNFSINISSNISSRFNINYTAYSNKTYDMASGKSFNITILVNTTSLTSGIYYYNITISSGAGTTILEKKINIQSTSAPYLYVLINTYSSSVARSQNNISLIATVENLGTEDATGVYLNWSLPSEFTITSGSQNKSVGNLPVGISIQNSIIITSSSSSSKEVTILALGTSSEGVSGNDSKQVTILPDSVVVGPGSGSSSGDSSGGSGGGSPQVISISENFEIVRGETDNFELEVENKYGNATLEDVSLSLSGYLSQYMTVTNPVIALINPKEKASFHIKLKAPAYKNYEEYLLNATISGYVNSLGVRTSYTEKRYLSLSIQEISYEDAKLKLNEAEKAIEDMKNANFSYSEQSNLLNQAKLKLQDKKNKDSYDLSLKIVEIRDKAFSIQEMLKKVIITLNNPRKVGLLTGNAVLDNSEYNGLSLREIYSGFTFQETELENKNLITGKAVSISENVKSNVNELVLLAINAFERGDYTTAQERTLSARSLLLLELKGNFWIFLRIYWYFIVVGMIVLSLIGIVGFRKYQKTSISRKIEMMNKEDNNINQLIMANQRNYFNGKISAGDYHKIMSLYQENMARIKKKRSELRNTRIKLLSSREISEDLAKERKEVEESVKKLQEDYYRDKKISEQEYKTGFEALNQRLAEIEDEATTLHFADKNRKGGINIPGKQSEADNLVELKIRKSENNEKKENKGGFFSNFFKNRREREERIMKEKIDRMLGL